MLEKMVSFIHFMEKTRDKIKAQPSDIYAMDKTAVWFDMLSETTVHEKGANTVSIKTSGHEKS